jgi:hypothetical protein
MFLSSNSFYVLCHFREVVKPHFLLMNVVLLAHLLPLYFIYHRLPLPNSVSIVYCIVQLIAWPSLSLGQDMTCDKFYNRLPHPLFSINTALAVAKPPVFPQIQITGVKDNGTRYAQDPTSSPFPRVLLPSLSWPWQRAPRRPLRLQQRCPARQLTGTSVGAAHGRWLGLSRACPASSQEPPLQACAWGPPAGKEPTQPMLPRPVLRGGVLDVQLASPLPAGGLSAVGERFPGATEPALTTRPSGAVPPRRRPGLPPLAPGPVAAAKNLAGLRFPQGLPTPPACSNREEDRGRRTVVFILCGCVPMWPFVWFRFDQ